MTQITQITKAQAGDLPLRKMLTESAAVGITLLSIAVCVILALVFDQAMLTTDTAQHISVARNIAAGHGFVTDLLYFEQQQVFGVMPAPQTVWPPLFPLLVTFASQFADEASAVFWVALIAHAATAPLVYATVRAAGYSPLTALASGAACLAAGFSSMLVLGGLTESLFTTLTVGAMLAYVRAESRSGAPRVRALLLAGLLAALAYLTRYSGLCLVLSLAALAGVRWLRSPNLATFRDGLLVALLPLTVVAATLTRNYLLTGSASGGPAVELGSSLAETLRTFYWSLAKLFGFDVDSIARTVVMAGVLALVLMALWRVACAWRLRTRAGWVASGAARARRGGLALAGLYMLGSVLLIGALAVTRYPEFVTDRYLIPLWPFAVCSFVFLLPPGHAWISGAIRRAAVPAFVVVLAALLSGQAVVVARELQWFADDHRVPTIRAALGERLAAPVGDADTVGALLSRADFESPLIEANGQYLGMLLRRPVVGLGETRFTKQVWDEGAVRELARRFNVKYLVFFPTLFSPGAIENRNRVFSARLHRGSVPPWLEPLHVSPRVQVYRIHP